MSKSVRILDYSNNLFRPPGSGKYVVTVYDVGDTKLEADSTYNADIIAYISYAAIQERKVL